MGPIPTYGSEEMALQKLLVVAAAILDSDGEIFTLPPPARHHDVIRLMREKGRVPTGPDKEQGFLLSDGKFCSREPAKRIAREAGQLLARASKSSDLFSEDVW